MSAFNDDPGFNVGALVTLCPPCLEQGDNLWMAKQIEIHHNLPPGDDYGRRQIDWSFGPVKTVGYVDTNTTITVNINLLSAKGKISVYLRNGQEVWIHLDIKIVFDGHYQGIIRSTLSE
ncbi:hypothetical protein BDP55DRAFT_766316 [Colletotrichum godetiae]|uniref:Uncharacterized protein n=1 Tax=Colletotrichum godetiae TaxID=1209918 RepID=A0AAJ0AR99_9PEZI|nr:uncharacterized protein BDP55DRAFT_766316 [Colletotrichum godetiae]KAK1688920.1 hypothetical protein BDP55DRAFT_766316 [Colletotrichum godetiae]